MTADEIEIFREARPEAAPYDPSSKARARTRILDGHGPAPRHRRRHRWVFVTSIATAGALAGGLFLLHPTEPASTEPGIVASSLRPVSAAEYLEKAARIVEQRPETRPRPSQWLYEKLYLKDGDGSMDRFHETWKRLDGQQASSQRDRDGKPVIDEQHPGRNERSPLQRYDHLRTLSTNPDDLLALAYNTDVVKKAQLSSSTEDRQHQSVFREIAELFEGVLTPPRLHAAAFRAIAKVPGVHVLPESTDLLGRPVVTISRTDEYGTRIEYLVDPTTYASRGMGSFIVHNDVARPHPGAYGGTAGKSTPMLSATRAPVGSSFYEIREAAGIVDEAGQLPR